MWLKSYGEKNGGPGQASGSKGPSKKPKNRVFQIFRKRQKFVTGSSNKNRSAGAWDNECRVPGGPKGHQAPRGTAPSKKFFSKKMAQSWKIVQYRFAPFAKNSTPFAVIKLGLLGPGIACTGGLVARRATRPPLGAQFPTKFFR